MKSQSLPVKKKLTLKTLNPYPPHYKTAFAFSFHPIPAYPSTMPHGRFSPLLRRDNRVYPVPHADQYERLRCRLSTEGATSAQAHFRPSCLTLYCFSASLTASLACSR